MKSKEIEINNRGYGFNAAVEETKKVAAEAGLSKTDTVRLELLTEEMLSMARILTGEMNATFWIEYEGQCFELNMSTKAVLDKMARQQLIESASSRKNEAAGSFLGKLRDAFEAAMASTVDYEYVNLSADTMSDLAGRAFEDPEWDQYEQSVLRSLADQVKVYIRRGEVRLTVGKKF